MIHDIVSNIVLVILPTILQLVIASHKDETN